LKSISIDERGFVLFIVFTNIFLSISCSLVAFSPLLLLLEVVKLKAGARLMHHLLL
jgi:hypothetical protein